MADEKVLKVFHAARQDIEIVWHQSGTIPHPIFDTQVAAMVLGYGDCIAYDQLVERITGHRPDKTHRFTDWSRRPLTDEQMHYAVSDVTHLRDVFAALDADLKKRGRSDWVSEEMEVLTSPKTYDFHPERAWERLKTRVRKPKELAVLMEVAAWREQEAQSRDVPRSRVLKDDAVGDIATHAPTSLERLANLRSLPKGFDRSKWGADIVAAVQRGLARDPATLPKIEKPRGNSNGAAIVELLKVLLRMTSERHAVASKVIATVDDLEADRRRRQRRRRRAARLAPRAVRRSGAVAEAWPAGAGDRKRPGGQGRSKLDPRFDGSETGLWIRSEAFSWREPVSTSPENAWRETLSRRAIFLLFLLVCGGFQGFRYLDQDHRQDIGAGRQVEPTRLCDRRRNILRQFVEIVPAGRHFHSLLKPSPYARPNDLQIARQPGAGRDRSSDHTAILPLASIRSAAPQNSGEVADDFDDRELV